MLTFAAGAAMGWLITGVCDFFAMKRAYRLAHEKGVQDTLTQVSGW